MQDSKSADGDAVPRLPYYINPLVFRNGTLLRAPAAEDSEATRDELAEEHRVEAGRTPEEVTAAKYDDLHEDIFLYQSVVGKRFTAQGMPLTAALSAHLRNDSGVVNAPLKAGFKRRRPYQFDKTIHAVCKTDTSYSYPSGHAMVGYLMGLTMAQMVPEKAEAILARADNYARNRVICGVHYPSDVAASKAVSFAMFGYPMATPKFQRDLVAATAETRSRLGLRTP